MAVLTCLDKIIGLSRTTCDCFSTNKPVDADTSKSGLFLDELSGGIPLAGVKNTGNACADMWALMEAARLEATAVLQGDIVTALNSKYTNKDKLPPFSGQICQKAAVLPLALTTAFAGTRFRMNYIKDAKAYITDMWTYMDATATFNIKVYKTYKDAAVAPVLVATIAATSTANALSSVTLSAPLELPLYDAMNLPITYTFCYDRVTAAIQPYDNKVTCNCGVDEAYEYMEVQGVTGNSTDDIRTWANNGLANGLVFNVDIKCTAGDLICRAMRLNDDIATIVAFATRFKANELLIEKVLGSSNPNQFTLSNREHWYGKRNHFRKEYESRIEWLVYNMPTGDSGCYGCADADMGIQRGTIIS